MKQFTPKLFDVMKDYNGSKLIKDIVAGIIVAIIALPLSIALAIASGVGPERGLYTAIFAGFVISFLGGSKVQISGPTAAFATIVAGIVAKNGFEGLVIATVMAGIILIVMGFLKLGKLIKFIPHTIATGFTAGIAITLVIGQLKDFLGLSYAQPIETIEKAEAVAKNINTFNPQALIIGGVALLILIVCPMIKGVNKIPPSLIAVLVTIFAVKIFNMDVKTIGDLNSNISSSIPTPTLPGEINFESIKALIPDAFTIAVLAAIESLLSCVVSDGMIGDKHKPNVELIAQGAGNIVSALFGGIPATGAIARTAANVKNGGQSPIAGMVHAITLLIILVVLMPYAALIPMPAIAAILFMVAYNMSGWREFLKLCKSAPAADILVLILTFVLTVAFDLVVAIEVGIVLAAFLFLANMSKTSDIAKEEYENAPENTAVYGISGPMFFAVFEKISSIEIAEGTKYIVLDMKTVSSIDISAMKALEKISERCKEAEIGIFVVGAGKQPMKIMEKYGFKSDIGDNNFFDDTESAFAQIAEI